jgi:hypothetical protein
MHLVARSLRPRDGSITCRPCPKRGPERAAPTGRFWTLSCTARADGRENDRLRDLIDLLLLRALVANEGLPAVREACVEIFALPRRCARLIAEIDAAR